MTASHFINTNRSLILLSVTILVVPLLMYRTTLAMANVWWINETFTHGFLVFPIVLWLIWEKRDHLAVLRPEPIPLVYLITLFACCIWMLSALIDIKAGMQLSMILIILSIALASLGWTIFSYLSFPLLFLFFAVPIGQGLIPPLMDFTANNTVRMVQMSGIPVYQDGLNFILPSGNWSVVEECSGVRYLIATLTLGVAYAYMTYATLKKRLIFIFFAIATPLVANSLRAYMIVMIGHFSGMELAVGADHLLYGWVLFGIIIFILFLVGNLWRDSKSEFDRHAPAPSGSDSPVATYYLVASLFVVALFQLSFEQLKAEADGFLAPQDASLELAGDGVWQDNPRASKDWMPVLHNPDIELNKAFTDGQDTVFVDIGYYFVQREEHETVSSANILVNSYGDGTWRLSSSVTHQTERFDVQEAVVFDNNRYLVWQWYRMGEFQTSNAYWAKIYQAYLLIFSDRNDGAYITLSTPLGEDKKTSREVLARFFNDSVDLINGQLDALQKQAEDIE